MPRRLFPAAFVVALSVIPAAAAWSSESDEESESPFELHVGGYGDLQFAFHDFGPNQNRDGGSQRDSRLVFDDARFVLKLEGEMPADIEFEAEVEFEHGGTGVTQEVEYEEFGEFETQVEKGGEVLLEELYIEKTFAERYSVAVGRFYVAVGLLSQYFLPTEYLASTRSEAETTVIPAVWPELGAQLELRPTDALEVRLQVVNGLDSTGFSSQRWVALGHQRRFEVVRATDLAGVLRVDVEPAEDVVIGASAYYGGTSRNRPKADLVPSCDAAGSGESTAPCGYVSAPVLIVDAHARLELGPVRASALALWGHLENAEAISSRNDRLSNALGVYRTPVADQALALSAEVGVDVAPTLGLRDRRRLDVYGRFDHYDTMFGTRDGLFDNPRFERTVVTTGLGYTLADAFFAKLDIAHRWFGSGSLSPENTVRLSTGFVY
ncbi:MAG: hypothetical protein H6698_05145 [Myxococcales bacterium]|nr:hypothetical protein [Myxococcales bacterium]MCB9519749.1 hypothetical protein [Myxococcales bacterium]MCB9530440.1 hypothetical protein [Myxococcales bacterium]MCB9533688.1 hypothetical protein [Myxococcales bacterium]